MLGHQFIILTNHRSLKELLTQVIQIPEQQMYLARLMGYDYCIQYRSGNTNLVADALSRRMEATESTLLLLSVPCLTFLEELKKQLNQELSFVDFIDNIKTNPTKFPDYSVSNDLVLQGNRIWLPQGIPFLQVLLTEYHSTPTGGHMGVAKTLARLTENFYWPGVRHDVKQFVAACVDCQQTKYETKRAAGLLCPLPVPCRPWEDLSLDFITGLPSFHGHTTILVVVDRFSKGVHLGMLPTQHSAYAVATLFMNTIGKLHGMPRSLVSDRDPLFISQFWKELFRLSGTQLRMSSAYHPQTNGQTEVLNRVLEQYLRAFVHKKPSSWGKFLPWAEWSYNTSRHSGTGVSPFEVTFGRRPPDWPSYVTSTSKVEAVDEFLTDRESIFQDLKKKLQKAQVLMKHNR